MAKLSEFKSGTVGWKAVDIAKKSVNDGRPVPKKTKTQLEKIVSDFPDTDLSRAASGVLEKMQQTQEQ